MGRKLLLVPAGFCLVAVAAETATHADAPEDHAQAERPRLGAGIFELSLSGYGEIDFGFRAYGADDTREGGALSDPRLVFDTTRFVAKLSAEAEGGIEIEAEVEFEHGGTGVTRELEYDEFGEFETEVEKGGEVQLEELYLEKKIGDWLKLKAGRFYLAIGTLSDFYRPTDYLGAGRSEAETMVIPAQWDEMGVSAKARFGATTITAQIVNGLDSSGFSSRTWIASGHQGVYETISARSLAAVARVDVTLGPHGTVGASAYVGGTNNRPIADLVATCDDPDAGAVAPCGYLSAPLVIADVHAHLASRGWRAQALLLAGHLTRAGAISERNDRLSNEAGVARTPVGDNAIAASLEVGYDIAPLARLRPAFELFPFVRLEHYDTMVAVRDALFDNPRFARTRAGLGVSLLWRRAVTAKAEVSRRWFASDSLRPEWGAQASLGFIY